MGRSRMRITAAAAVAGLAVAASGTAIAAGGSGSDTSFLDAVAAKLGISSEQLLDATKAAAIDRVDAQLKAGTITEAQADAMKERIQSGDGPGFGPGLGGPHGGPHGGLGGPGGQLDDAAAFLGLTTDALATQLQGGETLGEVAKEQGKSVDGLKAALLAGERKGLAEAVAAGRLTQAQADEILAGADARFDELIAGAMPQRGHGGRGFGPSSGTLSGAASAGVSL